MDAHSFASQVLMSEWSPGTNYRPAGLEGLGWCSLAVFGAGLRYLACEVRKLRDVWVGAEI